MVSKLIQRLRDANDSFVKRLKAARYEHLRLSPRYQPMTVKLDGIDFKIADQPSFYWSYREIFLDQIYTFKTTNRQPFILDCGSNYGISIVFFKKLFPKAKISGIEADPDIFNILEWNIAQRNYNKGDVSLHNVALSNTNGSTLFYQEGADGGRLAKNSKATKSIALKTIMLDEMINQPVDFLKMDIEGAETDVLLASKKLNMVSQLFVEYHAFSQEPQRLDELLFVLKKSGFRYYIQTQICAKQPLIETKEILDIDLQLNIFAKR